MRFPVPCLAADTVAPHPPVRRFIFRATSRVMFRITTRPGRLRLGLHISSLATLRVCRTRLCPALPPARCIVPRVSAWHALVRAARRDTFWAGDGSSLALCLFLDAVQVLIGDGAHLKQYTPSHIAILTAPCPGPRHPARTLPAYSLSAFSRSSPALIIAKTRDTDVPIASTVLLRHLWRSGCESGEMVGGLVLDNGSIEWNEKIEKP